MAEGLTWYGELDVLTDCAEAPGPNAYPERDAIQLLTTKYVESLLGD